MGIVDYLVNAGVSVASALLAFIVFSAIKDKVPCFQSKNQKALNAFIKDYAERNSGTDVAKILKGEKVNTKQNTSDTQEHSKKK